MGCGKEIEQTTAETIGGAAGFALGGPLGAAAGAGLGSAATGGNIKQDLIAAGTAGIGSSVDIGQALGLDTSISGTVENSVGSALSSVGDSLGITGGTSGSPIDTTPGGAPANPTTGQAMAAPANTTVSSPATGGGGTVSPGDVGGFDTNTINSQLSQGLNQGTNLGAGINAASPSFNASGAAADSALGSGGTDAIGSTGAGVATAAPSAAGASSGGGLLNTIENTAVKSALPLAGLAYSAVKGPASLPSQAKSLDAGGAVTAPLLALENQGANEALTGQLTPSQEASVTQMVQQAHNQLLQQLASAGVTNPTQDSRYIAGMQQIQEQAMALQQSYIQQAIQNATGAAGVAGSNIASVANEQVQLDTDYQNALASAFAALGGSVGGSVNINTQRPAA